MKWLIRILSGAALLLLLGFAGLYIWSNGAEGIWSYQQSLIIRQSPEEVFPWLTDPQKLPRWIENLEESIPLNGDSLRIGARSKEIVDNHGKPLEMMTEIRELEINRLLQVHITCDLFEHDARYELIPIPVGTQLKFTGVSMFKPFLFRLLTPLITPTANEQYDKNFRTLKSLIEEKEAEAAQ